MAHRWLVEALGDRELLDLAGSARSIAPEMWGVAVARVRLQRFPSLPESEGYRRVGFELGQSFLASSVGVSVQELVAILPLDRMMELFPGLGGRLRTGAEMSFSGDREQGVITFIGPRVTPPEVTLGFIQAIFRVLPTRYEVTLGTANDALLTLLVRRVAA